MSFTLPAVKSRPEYPVNCNVSEGSFGVPELMKEGFTTINNTCDLHPLIQSEQNYRKNKENLNMVMLRNTQGLHAPLRIAMELTAAKKIGHLPFLPSSNVMLDSLTGRDLDIGPDDIFGTAEFTEIMGQPHAVVEKSLGLLK